MKKTLFALTLATAALTGTATTVKAENEIWQRASGTEWAGGLAGKAHQPKGYYLFNEGHGSAVDFPLHALWDVNAFTQAGAPVQAANQASFNATHYGSTSFNMGGGKAGVFLNTYAHDGAVDYKMDGAFGGSLDNNQIHNWSFGPNSRVCFAARHKVTYFSGESDPKVQSYFSVFIQDTRLGKNINLTIKLWANRNEGTGEGWGNAEVGRYMYSLAKENGLFTTKAPGSDDSVIGRVPLNEERFYHTCITRQNLANMVQAYNEGLPEQLKASWDLNDYRVDGVFAQTEAMDLRHIAAGNDPNTWVLGPVRQEGMLKVGVLWSDHSVITRY
ncbi:hypothetical protein [Xanthomonas sp. SI]|uniref:hypothetical protein n=1 Tax=Xanthomonas sp. SI TaxID=2724123 RepID=UPI0016397ADA|nr:hypothetical protein [Xanthomonas sp. SI]QNH11521.1 hypothetical protein HEP75_00940 [Xanthomonas sp. SI]